MKNNIKYLIMDVDGTLTDSKIYISENGELMKAFNIKDGYGIAHILPDNHITPIIITGRDSTIVQKRCEELGISEIHQGVNDKLSCLETIIGAANYVFCAYIGDDYPDFDCMKVIKKYGGVIGCPFDAIDTIKEISEFVSSKNGGAGAVREFIDWLVKEGSYKKVDDGL